jgi:cytochrome c-type biogenesis protein CcmF
MLLANNVLLTIAMAAVMLGTLYPLFLDALDAGKISVGPPYFEAVFAPLMAPAVFLMAIGPVASWKRAELPALWTRLKWAFGIAVAAAVILPFVFGRWSPWVALGLLLSTWVIGASVAQVRNRIATSSQATLGARLAGQPAHWWGMVVAHLGIAIFILGVTMVKGYETERDIRMVAGDKTTMGGFEFTFVGTKDVQGANYIAVQGQFEVRREGSPDVLRMMQPEKRVYGAEGQTMTEAAIATRLLGDLYVSLGEPVDQGAWGVRVYHKPFVDWIWGGCFLMALGGFVALGDRRYRSKLAARNAAAGALAGKAA